MTHASRLTLVITLLAASACAPSASQLQSALEKNPEILFNVIEKHPDKFMASLQKAARTAEAKMAENAEQEEKARVEREMQNPLQPSVSEDRAFKGTKSAPITIVAYSDFQCPFCSRGHNTIEEVLKAYPGKVRYLHKHMPLSNHPMALPGAKRYEAIALQSPEKAVKFHDEVFAQQARLNSEGEKFLDSVAKKLGVDMTKMKADMNSETVTGRIQADMAEAEKFEITGTPGYVVAGVSVRGAYPFATFKEIIDKKLASGK